LAEFDRDRAITAGNSANVAGQLTAALIASGELVGQESVEHAFERLHVVVFNSNIGLAGAESVVEAFESPQAEVVSIADRAPAARPAAKPSPSGSGDPGTVVLKFGKHSGKTIAQVYDEDPGWLEWASESTNNDFIKGRINEFYRRQAA
jgi:hypothetical protein